MREIRFRAWDKNKSEMFYPSSISWKGNTMWVSGANGENRLEHEIVRDNSLVMQFTGLKDKNGKEIYEGDVLRINTESDNGYRFSGAITNEQVAWQETQGRWCITKGGENDFWSSLAEVQSGQMEVIGNIWENPELLKP